MASGCRTIHVPRPVSLFGALAAAVAVMLSVGCSGRGSAAEQDGDAPIVIDVHQTFIQIENRAGLPLTDVRIVIEAFGGTEFVHLVPRIENAAERDVMLNALSSLDGTTFRRGLVRAKAVRVTAADSVGRRYEVERPWQ